MLSLIINAHISSRTSEKLSSFQRSSIFATISAKNFCSKTNCREPTEADHEVLAELTNLSEKLKKSDARFLLHISVYHKVETLIYLFGYMHCILCSNFKHLLHILSKTQDPLYGHDCMIISHKYATRQETYETMPYILRPHTKTW